VIKYLGSKRTLVPLLTQLALASEAKTALDLFTGTTRVARSFKEHGLTVTSVDTASYSHVFAKTWIELNKSTCDQSELNDALSRLSILKPEPGYFTKTFCEDARYFQPKNGERVDAIRNAIEADYKSSWLYEPLLASLILAADRVDSTTGIQMAYLKQWASRSNNTLQLQDPGLLAGNGKAVLGDALEVVTDLDPVDLAYLDPPYNQHRYFTNYHIWETLVRWDAPQTYGIANKREDVRTDTNRSPFNSKPNMAPALARLIADVRAQTIVLSYNNESWLEREQLIEMCRVKGEVEVIDVSFKRYIGGQIGVYNRKGEKVGNPGAKRNTEHVVIAGPAEIVRRTHLASVRA
jgi:adenine-specific DNA-methyltransferase